MWYQSDEVKTIFKHFFPKHYGGLGRYIIV